MKVIKYATKSIMIGVTTYEMINNKTFAFSNTFNIVSMIVLVSQLICEIIVHLICKYIDYWNSRAQKTENIERKRKCKDIANTLGKVKSSQIELFKMDSLLNSNYYIHPIKAQARADFEEWKEKANKAEIEYNEKIAEYEKQTLLKEAMKEIEFTSESAKELNTKKIAEGVSVKNGKLIGFDKALEDAKKNDKAAFVDKEQKLIEVGKARFTQPSNNVGMRARAVTKADIMAIKDTSERQRAIAESLERNDGIF